MLSLVYFYVMIAYAVHKVYTISWKEGKEGMGSYFKNNKTEHLINAFLYNMQQRWLN